MANAYNGWPTLARFPVTMPGPHAGTERGFANQDVADVLAYLAWSWHTRIERVRLWGGGRTISYNASVGGHPQSCHVSGTATDTNWDDHPFEKRNPSGYRDGFTDAEERELRKIVGEITDSNGREVIRLGIDFDVVGTGLYEDAMHAEIGRTGPGNRREYVSPAQVAQAARRIRKTFTPPRSYAEIKNYQKAVGVTPDGSHGPSTTQAIRELQEAIGIPQTGLWDEATKKSGEDMALLDDIAKDVGYIKDAVITRLSDKDKESVGTGIDVWTAAQLGVLTASRAQAGKMVQWKNLAATQDVRITVREVMDQGETNPDKIADAVVARLQEDAE